MKNETRTIEFREMFSSLKEIPNPPSCLYIRGNIPPQNSIFLTVVGSRKWSPYGREACRDILQGLSGFPVVIVSGLAIGIDSIAHEAALDFGLKTIGVPGSGLDDKVLYPRTNLKLAHEIIKKGGCLVSEFSNEQNAEIWTFPKRNRIMAGLSKATLVIEAEEKSGTLITARLALDFNRDVLAVPGSIFSKCSEGSNLLIKKGATPIRNSFDLIEALQISEINNIENAENLSDEELFILKSLTKPISKEELLSTIGYGAEKFFETITLLEIKGLVEEKFGKLARTCDLK